MAGILEAIRDNLEYIQDVQYVESTPVVSSSNTSFYDKVLSDLEDIQPKESVDFTKIALIGGAVVVGILLIRELSK